MEYQLTPITNREYPGICKAGDSMLFRSYEEARDYAIAHKIQEYMISSNARPVQAGDTFNIATL